MRRHQQQNRNYFPRRPFKHIPCTKESQTSIFRDIRCTNIYFLVKNSDHFRYMGVIHFLNDPIANFWKVFGKNFWKNVWKKLESLSQTLEVRSIWPKYISIRT